MNILEYALDVNKTKEEILELCKRLDISASNDDDILSDDDITLLDNEIQQMEDYIVKEEDTSVDEVEDDYDYNFYDDEVIQMKKKINPLKIIPQEGLRYSIVNIISYIKNCGQHKCTFLFI